MHLTASFKLRANDHDRARMEIALGRWSAAMNEVMDRAQKVHLRHPRGTRSPLLACIVMWTSKDGTHSRLVIDRKALHALVLKLCAGVNTHLHSSSQMSLIVAIEAQLGSYLGQIIDWKAADRALKLPKPSFPRLPPATDAAAETRWTLALEQAAGCASYAEEVPWRSNLLRASRARLLPLYFGAATSGAQGNQAHMGLLQREDGRLFALLTLFPSGDPRGEPVQRARNRTGRGPVRTFLGHARRQRRVRDGAENPASAEDGARQADGTQVLRVEDGAQEVTALTARPFAPTPRARASIMVPLEFSRGNDPSSSHGREFVFLRRAAPKSAELVHREREWYLHVAFDFPEHPPRPRTGAVLAVKRGIETLVAWSLLAPGRDGAHLIQDILGAEDGARQGGKDGALRRQFAHGRLEGGDLVRLVTAIRNERAQRQERGHSLKGDRRLARLTEAHLYSAGHQIVDLACKSGAEIVLLKDRLARKPQPFLAYRHFHRLAEILVQLAAEAGLPPPRERELYGSWATCLQCGWRPGDPVRIEDAGAAQCAACGIAREPEFHLASLLAYDTLRLRTAGREKPPPLGQFIQSFRQGRLP